MECGRGRSGEARRSQACTRLHCTVLHFETENKFSPEVVDQENDGGGNAGNLPKLGATDRVDSPRLAMVLRQRNKEANDRKDEDSGGGKSKGLGGKFHPRFGGHGRLPERTADHTALPHQTWARMVMFASVVIVVYMGGGRFSGDGTGKSVMARGGEPLREKRYQQMLCAPSYRKEIKDLGSEGCLPKKCGRFVTDDVVTEDEAHELLELAKKGLSKGGSSGGASILDLHSGALSHGEQFVNLYKVHPELFRRQDFEVYVRVQEKVRSAVAAHFGLPEPSSLRLTHPTFFSRLTSRPPSTPHDEYWHLHVDKETYPAFHYTSLLYLTDHGVDFEGGEFVFVDGDDKLNRTIEPRLGRVSAFTSGVENKHHVQRVTDGVRYALTMGFTCDSEKAIAAPGSQLED